MRADQRIVLYHAPLAVCAAKVRMTLAEKQIPWTSVEIDLAAGEQFSPAYRMIHPGEVVPALRHGDRIIRDSTVINAYLDDCFAQTPLRPDGIYERALFRAWAKQEDEIQAAINSLVTALVLRPSLLTKGAAAISARHTDFDRRERWDSLMRLGVDSPYIDRALRRLARWLADIDASLQDRDYLAGASLSLADIGHIPYVHALALLQLHGLWRERPSVEAWRLRIGARPSFIEGVARYVSPRAADAWARGGDALKAEITCRFRAADNRKEA